MNCSFNIVEQGYLAFSKGMSTRIRSVVKPDKEEPSWVFTFKQKVKERVVEIERKLTDRDGQDLWRMAVGKLKKRRYEKADKSGLIWEVDFFYDKSDHCYFSMAEVEMEEGAPPPTKLPSFIKDYLVFSVPLTDDRFSNKRLGDAEYAASLFRTLRKEAKL